MIKGSDPRFIAALGDCARMNRNDQWARLRADEYGISVEYGPIHSNGVVEYRTGRREYHWLDRSVGTIHITSAHLGG